MGVWMGRRVGWRGIGGWGGEGRRVGWEGLEGGVGVWMGRRVERLGG